MYCLEYLEPHEYDDGFSGKGHEISWELRTVAIEAQDDEEARVVALSFLEKGGFTHEGRKYKRKGCSMMWIPRPRHVMGSDDFKRKNKR